MTKAGLGGRQSDRGKSYYCWWTGGITTVNLTATDVDFPADLPTAQALLHAEILVCADGAPPTFTRTSLTIVAVTPTGNGEIQLVDKNTVSIYLTTGLITSDFLVVGYRTNRQTMS